jgi:hypothetical protein
MLDGGEVEVEGCDGAWGNFRGREILVRDALKFWDGTSVLVLEYCANSPFTKAQIPACSASTWYSS